MSVVRFTPAQESRVNLPCLVEILFIQMLCNLHVQNQTIWAVEQTSLHVVVFRG